MSIPEQPWWQILQCSSDSSKAEISAAYRRLAARYHPDCEHGSRPHWDKIQQAYEKSKNI